MKVVIVVIDWFIQGYAYLAIFPFIPFIFIWFIAYYFSHDKKKSTKLSMDLTTFLLVGSVSVMVDTIIKSSFGGFWLILLFFLVAAGLIGNYQNRNYGHIILPKLIIIIWRISFMILSVVYLLLLLTAIIINLFFK